MFQFHALVSFSSFNQAEKPTSKNNAEKLVVDNVAEKSPVQDVSNVSLVKNVTEKSMVRTIVGKNDKEIAPENLLKTVRYNCKFKGTLFDEFVLVQEAWSQLLAFKWRMSLGKHA